jgi:hypothetical protein
MNIFSRHNVSFVAAAVLIVAGLGCAGLDDSSSSGSGSSSGWAQELAGKKIMRAQSSGSFSDTYSYWFCSSGDYLFKQDTVGMSYGGGGTGSMASQDFQRGKWSVSSSTLTLISDDGSKSEAQLSPGSDSDAIRLDGTPFAVSRSNECP